MNPLVAIDALVGELRYDDRGLIPAVVQSADDHSVLMVAWISAASLEATIAQGRTVFWSRSRQELWAKGATSGDVQEVVEILVDCDADTLLIKVHQHGGGACHTGSWSCFDRSLAEVESQ